MAVKGLSCKGSPTVSLLNMRIFFHQQNLFVYRPSNIIVWVFNSVHFFPAGDHRMCACPQTSDFAKVVLNKCVVMHSNDARTFK